MAESPGEQERYPSLKKAMDEGRVGAGHGLPDPEKREPRIPEGEPDDLTHYMQATSRLTAECSSLRSQLVEAKAETEKVMADAKAALDSMFETAKQAMEEPHPLVAMGAYFEYSLGTTGDAYQTEGFRDIVSERNSLSAQLVEAREALEEISILAEESGLLPLNGYVKTIQDKAQARLSSPSTESE